MLINANNNNNNAVYYLFLRRAKKKKKQKNIHNVAQTLTHKLLNKKLYICCFFLPFSTLLSTFELQISIAKADTFFSPVYNRGCINKNKEKIL